MGIFSGVGTALVTPFTKTNKVNYNVFKKLIDFQIESGINALVFLGTTGEPSTLNRNEKLKICEFAVDYVAGRVPVILGAGSNNTDEAVMLSREYEKIGANALLSVTPYYNKCTQLGLVKHFENIAKSVSVPIILYNVPSRTSVNIMPESVKDLSNINNIVAIKEASGNLEQSMQIIKSCSSDFYLYSGDDSLIVPIMSIGGHGVISVVSNLIPSEMVKICECYFQGKTDISKELQLKYLNLIKLLFCEVNPIPIKMALNLIGFNVGIGRLPLTKMQNKNKLQLITELKNLKII